MKDYLKLFESEPNKTCFILKKETIVFSSTEKGVKPILDYYNELGISNAPLLVVDKIMGKGAVVLAIFIGANKLVTPIISKDALSLANEYNLEVTYNTVVPYIINRDGDGRCPIESSVLEIESIKDGFNKIIKTLKALSNK
jgi:hypothetical protein